jgi:Tfp pilus assembly protein PilX
MNSHRSHSRGEAGSAYIITLLALVVLTILALGLALVTQTEVKVGSNERTVNRAFYAADSGLAIAMAEYDAAFDTGKTVLLNKTSVGAGSSLSSNVADRVTFSSVVPINRTFSNLSMANYGKQAFYRVDLSVNASAQRVAWNGSIDPPADATVLGQKTVSAMFMRDPASSPQTDSFPSSFKNN